MRIESDGGSYRVATQPVSNIANSVKSAAERAAAAVRRAVEAAHHQAVSNTAGARKKADTALGKYRGAATAHQKKWVAAHGGEYKTNAARAAAWQTAWQGSPESKQAETDVQPYLAQYSAAVQQELRLASLNGHPSQKAASAAIDKEAGDLRAQGKSDDFADGVLDNIVTGAATQIKGESFELRTARVHTTNLSTDYSQKQTNLKTVLDRRDKTLQGVNNGGMRQDIRKGFAPEIQAAQKGFDDASTALKDGLTAEYSIAAADGVLAQSPGSAAAKTQWDQVLAGHYEALNTATPEQADAALQSVFSAHPELIALQSKEGIPFAVDVYLQGEALKHRPEIDANMQKLPSIAADPKTPQWMKDLIASDPASAALIASLKIDGGNNTTSEVYSVSPTSKAEQGLAKQSPLVFGLLKYLGADLQVPQSSLDNPQPTELVNYGLQSISASFKKLQGTEGKSAEQIAADKKKITDLQGFILASGDARTQFIRAEWQHTASIESPKQNIDKITGEYLEENDFDDPNATPATEAGKFAKSLQINMQAAALLNPGSETELWTSVAPDIHGYLGQQADYIQAHYGDNLPTVTGEWQKQWAQFAPPPLATDVADVTASHFTPTALLRGVGNGRVVDGLQMLADHAGTPGATHIAQWLTAGGDNQDFGVPLRDFMAVKEDGTGTTLGKAILSQLTSKGVDEYGLSDLQSWYDASVKIADEKHGKKIATDQVNLFSENRNDKLQTIFDTALRENGDVFAHTVKFGQDVRSDNEYGQKLGLPTDNPPAGDDAALYTDPAKLEKIHTFKQISWISRGANLPVDLNALAPLIARGDPLPESENLRKINQIRSHIRDVAGDNATVTFTPAVYTSNKVGVESIYLIRAEGDKNKDGVVTHHETTTPTSRGRATTTLDDEDIVIDATAIAQDENARWQYSDFQNFQEKNKRLDDHGTLYMAGTSDFLLHDDNRDNHVDNINFKGVDAAITTFGERAWQVADVGVGLITAVAMIGSFTPLAPIMAPIAMVGGTYLGVRSGVSLADMHEHGESWASTAGVLAWAGVLTAVLPAKAGTLRAFTLYRSGMTARAASRVGFGAFYFKNPTSGWFPAPYVADAHTIMQAGSKAFTVTKILDGASIAIGAPLLGTSMYDTAVNWNETSGWDRVSRAISIASGIYGTGKGVQGFLANGRLPEKRADEPDDTPTPDVDPPITPVEDEHPIVPATALFKGRDVANLSADDWNGFNPDETRAIQAPAFESVALDQIPSLSDDTVGSFTGEQFAQIRQNRLRQFTETQIPAIDPQALPYIPGSRFPAFSREQFAAFTREQQGWMTLDQLSHVTSDQLAGLSEDQLRGFTPEQRGAFSARQRSKLSPEQIAALDEPWLQTPHGRISVPYDVPEIATPYRDKPWNRLTGDEFASVSGRKLTQVAGSELAKIDPEVFAKITREQQMWLTAKQCAALTAEQLAALDPRQLGAFTQEQREAFRAPQLRDLNAAQAGALTWPQLALRYGPRTMSDVMPTPFNGFNPVELQGLPAGRAASPIHEIAHFFPGRGINKLAALNGVESGARALSWAENQKVMLVTGFSVAEGMPETDGPPGTALLGRILHASGKDVTYVTGPENEPVLRAALAALGEHDAEIIVFDAPHEGDTANQQAAALLDSVQPNAVMAIELPGRTVRGEYENMRGVHIDGFNPPLDAIVLEANRRWKIATLGVGDGGNESGMGNVRDLVPPALDGTDMASNVPARYPITASVSNLGAEAVGIAYAYMIGRPDLIHTPEQQYAALDATARAGAVDGVTRLKVPTADGFSGEAHMGLRIMLGEAASVTGMDPIVIGMMDSSDGGLYAARMFGDMLVEKTGRRLIRVMGLDHGNAPYGPIAIDPDRGPVEIGRLTNNVLKTLKRAMETSSSRVVLAMACNTACTGHDYFIGLADDRVFVIDLVKVTAQAMTETGGSHIVSLSTSGTQSVHAYQDAVATLNPDVQVTEIGGSRRPILRDGKPFQTPDLADIVNRLNTENPPSRADIQRAVDYYIDQVPTDATSLWLTCTHYPALTHYIETALARRGMDIPVINPMEHQVRATIEQLGIDVADTRPAGFQRSRPPMVVTSGKYAIFDAAGDPIIGSDNKPMKVFGDELAAVRSEHPDWRIVDEQLTSARAVLGREDVRVVHVKDFSNVSDEQIGEIRHAIYRPNTPQDGTLHELSVKMFRLVGSDGQPVLDAGDQPLMVHQDKLAETLRNHNSWKIDPDMPEGRWVPMEVLIRQDEMVAYKELNEQFDGNFQLAYDNVLRSVAGYGPLEPPAPATPAGPTAPTPPSPAAAETATPAGWRVRVVKYAPLVAATTTLAATVPPQYLTLANGTAWILRGLGTLPMAIAPQRFAANTTAGRILRAWNGMTFIPNAAYHGFTYSTGASMPANQLYAVSDHGSLFQNAHEAAMGNTKSPPRWMRLGTLGFANAANAALLPVYSLHAGPGAWGPNLLFGGGTAYLTYKALGGQTRHDRIATGAVAVGLMAFGAHYVLNVALPLLKGDRPQVSPGQTPQPDDTGTGQAEGAPLYQRLDENVFVSPWGRIALSNVPEIPDEITHDPALLHYVKIGSGGGFL